MMKSKKLKFTLLAVLTILSVSAFSQNKTKKSMEIADEIVKINLRQENRYYEDAYRSNEDVNYWLKRDIIV